MLHLDASAVLGIWEDARGLDAITRSVQLAASTEPEMGLRDAASIPIGARNTRLIRLRSLWEEGGFEATAQCPHCGAVLEFDVDLAELMEETEPGECEPIHIDNRIIRWRPVASNDLLEAGTQLDVASAERTIIDRCVTEVLENDRLLVGHHVTDSERAALAEALEASDPLSELLVDLKCVDCGGSMTADLQIPDVVWSELDSIARGLLADVDTLARAYGWTEAECLELSPGRRAIYLELATGGIA